MGCLYYIGNNEFNYNLLISFLGINKIKTLDDLNNLTSGIKFSFATQTSKKIDEKLQDLKTKGFTIQELTDSDYAFTDIKSVLDYIDSHDFEYLYGKRSLPMKVDTEEFKKWAKKHWVDGESYQGYSEAQLDEKLDKICNNWKDIKLAAKDLHIFITLALRRKVLYNDKYGEFETLLNEFPNIKERIKGERNGHVLSYRFFNQLCEMNKRVYENMKGIWDHSEAKGMEKLNLKFDGVTIDSEDDFKRLGIHIDRLFVDRFGRVHVFNFKLTTNDYKYWSKNKKMKYRYEMAFLRQILLQNGIDMRGAKFYHVPIIMDYNDDFSYITDVRIGNMINYNSENGKSIFDDLIPDVNKHLLNYLTLDAVTDDKLQKTEAFTKLINPDWNPDARGLYISAKSWINRNKHNIKRNFETGGWTVELRDNKKLEIADSSPISINEELLEKVKGMLKENNTGEYSVQSVIVDAVINNYSTHTFFENGRSLRFDRAYLKKALGKYFTYKENKTEGTRTYEWELNEDLSLIDCGILMFHNVITNQVDLVVASTFNPLEQVPVGYEHHTKILGYYMNDAKNSSTLDNTYGNMEIMRAISLLNEIAPQLGTELKLGQIQVLSNYNEGSGRILDLETAVKEYNKVGTQLHLLHPDYEHQSNFKSSLFIDRARIAYDIYQDIIDVNNSQVSTYNRNKLISELSLDDFKTLTDSASKLARMREVMKYIEEKLGMTKPEDIFQATFDTNPETRGLALIYVACAEDINRFNGLEYPEIKYLNKFKRYVLPLYANPDANVRAVAGLYNRALDKIAQDFLKEYSPLRKLVMEFYKAKGYTGAFGTGTSLFENMYSKTDGEMNWKFVNPFDPKDLEAARLDSDESEFLKQVIFEFAKIRERRSMNLFTFKSYKDKGFADYVNGHSSALLVPLEKRMYPGGDNIGKRLKNTKQEITDLIDMGVGDYVRNKIDERSKKNPNYVEKEYYKLSVNNLFAAREEEHERNELINKFGNDYFETNLEYLLADYVESQIAAEELLKVEFLSKALLMEMEILSEKSGTEAELDLQTSIKEIQDFMKLNVFGKTLLDPSELEMINLLNPAKHLLSKMFIAWNLKGAVRDTFEGIWLNFSLSISKYYEDLDAADILLGYKAVLEGKLKSENGINIISELCLKYRLSNTDVARIAEKAKVDTGGVFNFDKLGYSTLRGPDFLNRMTLFAAKCIRDGSFDAFSIDEETGALKYDWKLDKRFEKFANNQVNDPDYIKLKSLYYYYVSEYNKEHPENQISYDPEVDPLPEPYTSKEIETMKNVANTKYGAYDKSQKAKMSHAAWGQAVLIFNDWFNGHTAAWMREKGFYDDIFSLKDADGNYKIKKAASGNEMWMDKNGNIYEKTQEGKIIDEEGKEVTEGEFVPVLDKVPIYAQGIIYTLKDTWSVIKKDGLDFLKFKDEIWANEWDRENYFKLGNDLAFWTILALIFGNLIPGLYKEYKKQRDPEDLLSNALVDVLYSGSTASYEAFKGPVAIYDYVVSDIKPSLVANVWKSVSDIYKTAFGDKTFAQFATSDIPVIRLGKDALKQMYPDLFKTT